MASETLTPPANVWVTLRVGGDRMTRVEAKAGEQVEVELERRDANTNKEDYE